MHIVGELQYSSLRKGIGYLKLLCAKTTVLDLLKKVEQEFGIRLAGDNVHMSIVRDEAIPFTKYWNRHKEPVGISLIDDNISTDGRFFWVDVKSGYVELIRTELGLSSKPNVPLHLTLGSR